MTEPRVAVPDAREGSKKVDVAEEAATVIVAAEIEKSRKRARDQTGEGVSPTDVFTSSTSAKILKRTLG